MHPVRMTIPGIKINEINKGDNNNLNKRYTIVERKPLEYLLFYDWFGAI